MSPRSWDLRAWRRAVPGLVPGFVLVATLVIAAAEALFDAESELDSLDLEIAANEQRIAELEAEVGGMRSSLGELALRRFTAGGVSSNPLFSPVSEINDAEAANVFTGVATGSVIADTDQFEATLEELDDARASLARNRSDAQAARDELERLQAFAESEVVRLKELEEQRLTAEAEAELARMRQERVAAQRAAAEEVARQQAEQQALQQQQQEQLQQQQQQQQQQVVTPDPAPAQP